MRRKKYLLPIWIVSLAALLAGCGSTPSSSTQQNQNPPTGIAKRVLLSNESRGFINILDAQKNVPSTKTISASAPSKLVTAGGITAVLDNGLAEVTILDNTKEQVTFNVLLADAANDIAITNDGKTVWVAERNNGFVQSIDTTAGVVTASVPVPSAERVVLSPSGSRLLAFSNNPQGLPGPSTTPHIFENAFFVIDTAGARTTPQAAPINLAVGDQPFSAVFGSSETQAFILNCGSGCGGVNGTTPTAPSVLSVDFTNAGAPVLGTRTPVPAATAGILSNGNLFVAGTTSPTAVVSPGTGFLQVLNVGTLALAGAPVQITDGVHTKLVLTSNNRLYIAARGCTPGPAQANNTRAGCLSIANVANPGGLISVAIPSESIFRQNFDVTGIQPISNSNIVYVAQGGELDFFDITTDAVSTSITSVDILGLAFDVVQIDP
jgi:hypothetical protein